MLNSYLTGVWRVLTKYKKATVLNLTCLTLGLTVSIILLAYSLNEYSYDLFHVNANRIYQLWASVQMGPNEDKMDRFSISVADELPIKYSGIESSVRIAKVGKAVIKSPNGVMSTESNILFSDPQFFSVFTFPLSAGSAEQLEQPNSIFISDEMSKKYFGNDVSLGKMLSWNDTLMLKVEGVFNRFPDRSSMSADFIVSFATLKKFKEYTKEFNQPYFGLGRIKTFVLLKDRQDPNQIEDELPKQEEPFKVNSYHLEPLTGAHVRNYGRGENSNIPLYMTISFVLFAVVIINSINITSSQHIERTHEIIIRKINGASRIDIIAMFYFESFIISLFSLLIAFVFSYMSLGFIQNTLSITIEWTYLLSFPFLYYAIGALIIMVVCGGVYPFIVLSTMKPRHSLISPQYSSAFSKMARWSTVLFQFTISSVLILVALLVNKQLSFIGEKDLGIQIDNVLVFPLDRSEASHYLVFKNKLKTIPGVTGVGAASFSLFKEPPMVVMAGRTDSSISVPLSMMNIDKDLMDVIDIVPLNGTLGTSGVVLNETASQTFFGSKDAVGRQISIGNRPMDVISTVKDFNFANLRERISSLSFSVADDSAKVFGYIGCQVYVRISKQASTKETISKIGKIAKNDFPSNDFKYEFLDQIYDQDYIKERQLLKAVSLFTFIAIAIACFGLIGQLMFRIVKMLPQLSIRKVLGAGSIDLFFSLFKEVFLLVAFSLIIAIPIAYYLIRNWMEAFTYKTDFSFWTFLGGIGIVVIIILPISLFFLLRIQWTNPIAFLRKE